ncbi:glutathione S-transferase Mu 1-like [Sycon ciliatum]|uniref:glutathione S-transferase Mu 1-like n=1 Tax=Sycon ciliatum TaxID=27933 RepID=UPI0031F60652
MPAVLGYWKIRGLATAARYMLAYTDTEWEDAMYECGAEPPYDRSSWLEKKFTLGLGPFANLPYFIDGDVKIVESNAILRYIGDQHNLCGTTKEEKAYCNMYEHVVMGFRNGFVGLCYDKKGFEERRAPYIKELKETKLPKFAEALGDKKFLCGDNITFPDFHFFELLDQHLTFEPGCLDDFPTLKAYHERIAELPKIKAYRASDRFVARPVNNPSAQWK